MRVNQFLNMYIFLAGGDRAAGKIDESMIKTKVLYVLHTSKPTEAYDRGTVVKHE